MVFCYKIITETPRVSGSGSPRKRSPVRKIPNGMSLLVYLMSSGFVFSFQKKFYTMQTFIAPERITMASVT